MNSQTPWSVLPAAFLDRLTLLVPDEAQRLVILHSFEQRRPSTFRVNTLKATVDEVFSELTAAGFELEPVEWLPGAFTLRNRTQRELTEHEIYNDGKIYLQSLSSMIPPLVLEPQPGEVVLDLTAAPGSKTTQMAAMMQNAGQIVANDASLVRTYKLQANLEMQGVVNTNTRRGLGQDLWRQFPEVFDKTLVDVPCSMEGRFLYDQPKTYENWSPKKNKELAQRQRMLLRSAVSATKPGGVIVYSTCTLSPDENELALAWLLHKEGDAIEVLPFELAGSPLSPALTEWEGKSLPDQIAHARRIYPTAEMEGFFVAKLRKTRSTL